MIKIKTTPKFERDFKKYYKKNHSVSNVQKAITAIRDENQAELRSMRIHPLHGSLSGFIDIHIESDLILLYKKEDSSVILVRLSSHDDLF